MLWTFQLVQVKIIYNKPMLRNYNPKFLVKIISHIFYLFFLKKDIIS
jgi:hypothetical protein